MMSKPAVMRRMPQIAHVDVNCFYASAERAWPRVTPEPGAGPGSADRGRVTRMRV